MAGMATVSLLAAPLTGVASARANPARFLSQTTAKQNRNMPFVGYAKPAQRVNFLVHLPLRNKAEAEALSHQLATPKSPLYHKWLKPAQFAARFGPTQADVAKASAALRAGGMRIDKVDAQFIHASAPAASVERFFGTRLGLVRDGTVSHVNMMVDAKIPDALTRLNATVIGLHAVGLAKPNYVARSTKGVQLPKIHKAKLGGAKPNAFFGPYGPYFPGELLQAYGQPSYTYGNGNGETIAIVGYSDSADSDNHTEWCYYGLGTDDCYNGSPYPTVNHYEALGSFPPNSGGDSVEATLDAQMVGGSAPGAVIDQYAADAVSNFGFLDMYSYIVNNDVDDIITTSYGDCELYYTGYYSTVQYPYYYIVAYDDTFLQGTLQGQTFMFSSGDNGGLPCPSEPYVDGTGSPPFSFVPSVSIYADDPNVTAVGGTTLLYTNFFDGGYGTGYNYESSYSYAYPPGFFTNETYGSGGGVSQIWDTPGYQLAIGLPSGGRQVPDIAMHMGGFQASMDSADWVYSTLYGGYVALIGTSASSPEYAGWLAESLSAVANAQGNAGADYRVGQLNDINYYLQAIGDGTTAFNQYMYGDNGVVSYCGYCTPGYNQVTGLGTPNFAGFTSVIGLPGLPQAGDTFTPSNP